MSLPLSRLTVERDRTCPIAPMKKGDLRQLVALHQFIAISMLNLATRFLKKNFPTRGNNFFKE